MSQWVPFGILYVLTVLAALWVWSETRKKRPKTTDELDASIAQLRLRMADSEDRLERHLKRDAVREHRGRETEIPLAVDRQSRLQALRQRIAAARGKGG